MRDASGFPFRSAAKTLDALTECQIELVDSAQRVGNIRIDLAAKASQPVVVANGAPRISLLLSLEKNNPETLKVALPQADDGIQQSRVPRVTLGAIVQQFKLEPFRDARLPVLLPSGEERQSFPPSTPADSIRSNTAGSWTGCTLAQDRVRASC